MPNRGKNNMGIISLTGTIVINMSHLVGQHDFHVELPTPHASCFTSSNHASLRMSYPLSHFLSYSKFTPSHQFFSGHPLNMSQNPIPMPLKMLIGERQCIKNQKHLNKIIHGLWNLCRLERNPVVLDRFTRSSHILMDPLSETKLTWNPNVTHRLKDWTMLKLLPLW